MEDGLIVANVSKYQRDVVVRCNHGVTDGTAEYVSRYRFMAEQEVWAAVDRGGTQTTEVGGSADDDGWFSAKQAAGPRHEQQKIRCRRCGKELSITRERLDNLLSLVAPQAETVTIAGLQTILRGASALRRN